MVDDLILYHFWGIDPGVLNRVTILGKVKLLYKLVYHQAPEHRPRHLGDMVYAKMDAGPRLLSRSITDPIPLPVSRFYPDLPSQATPLRDDYSRPSDAAPDVPDVWLQQHLLSSKRQPDEQRDGYGRVGPAHRAAAKRRPGQVYVPSYNIKDVVDAIERAVFRFAYIDLERHSTAAPLAARPHIFATDEEDLFKAVIGSFPAVSHVNMSFDAIADAWKFENGAKPYVYLGRGPVGRNNSSAVDCAIVVGRLLDAGSTVIDRRERGWALRFTQAERAFIEATDLNWDICSPEISMDQRDQLWDVLGHAEPSIGMGNINPFWTIWSTCTGNFAQFQFHYAESASHCPCSGRGVTTEECTSAFVSASLGHGETPGATMQELVSRYFAPSSNDDCEVCRSEKTVRKKRFASLPLRMVVLCDDPRVKNHTNDLSFTYADCHGNEMTAKYRWLGGVYYKNSRFRVVWTDTGRGEYDDGSLRFYDGATNSGLIVGGIPPAHHSERVPGGWMGEKIIPLLVYERVMNPDVGVLTLAKKSIEDMMGFQTQEQLILDAHAPWAIPEKPSGLITQPWARVLPERGQRFHTAATAHFPGEPGHQSPVSTFSDVLKRNQPTAQMTHGYLDPPLPRLSSPFERMNQALGSTRLRSRTPMSMLNSSAFGSRRSSMMHLDSETQTNPESHLLSSSPPAAVPAWIKSPCAPEANRRPSMEDDAVGQGGNAGRKKKTVRFEGTKSRSKAMMNKAKRATRKSSRQMRKRLEG